MKISDFKKAWGNVKLAKTSTGVTATVVLGSKKSRTRLTIKGAKNNQIALATLNFALYAATHKASKPLPGNNVASAMLPAFNA